MVSIPCPVPVTRLTFEFLGTGTSAGVPCIACDCDVCTSTDPRDRRLRTSAVIRFSDPDGHPRTILIDAGPDLRTQALRAGLDRCDAVFITHHHVDHCFGIDELRRFNAAMRAPITLYAEPDTLSNLSRVYQHIFQPEKNIQKSFIATLIPTPIKQDETIDLFGLRITPLRLMHGRMPIAGFRIEHDKKHAHSEHVVSLNDAERKPVLPLAYCTDVSKIPTETWPNLQGLSTLILDALRFRKHPTHLTVHDAQRIAENSGAAQTYLVHMNHEVPHAETDASLPDTIRLAFDGLVLREPDAHADLPEDAQPNDAKSAAG